MHRNGWQTHAEVIRQAMAQVNAEKAQAEEAAKVDEHFKVVAHAYQMKRVEDTPGFFCADLCPAKAIETPEYAPEVKAFVKEQKLSGFMMQATDALKAAFGNPVKLDPYLFEDHETGNLSLSVRILVSDLKASRLPFSEFCHTWWYDRIAEYGDRVSLKVAYDGGL